MTHHFRGDMHKNYCAYLKGYALYLTLPRLDDVFEL